MKVTAEVHYGTELFAFLRKLDSPLMRQAGARGLSEHADEQRRQSVTRIAASTGVPKARVAGKTRVIRASASGHMTARVRTSDVAIPLGEYGVPRWDPSSRGAEATGWNVRRTFPGAFVRNGQVLIRTSKERYPLKLLSMAVLANELAKPSRPNVPAAGKFAKLDLEKRVVRHVIRALGV